MNNKQNQAQSKTRPTYRVPVPTSPQTYRGQIQPAQPELRKGAPQMAPVALPPNGNGNSDSTSDSEGMSPLMSGLVAALVAFVALTLLAVMYCYYVRKRKRRYCEEKIRIVSADGNYVAGSDETSQRRKNWRTSASTSWTSFFSKSKQSFGSSFTPHNSVSSVNSPPYETGVTNRPDPGMVKQSTVHTVRPSPDLTRNAVPGAQDTDSVSSWFANTVYNFMDNNEEGAPPNTPRKSSKGFLNFSIYYDPVQKILELKILSARHLEAKDVSGTSDPYVVIKLLPDKIKMKTRVKHKTLNPVWNDVFQFEGISVEKLQTRTVMLRILDHDRFSRDDAIGEILFPLQYLVPGEPYTRWKELEPCTSYVSPLPNSELTPVPEEDGAIIQASHSSNVDGNRYGKIQIGLKYSPGESKLEVNLYSCSNLAAKDLNQTSDPYIKLWFIYQGEKVIKYKTEVKEKTLNPTYDKTYVFPLEANKLKEAGVLISVKDHDTFGRNDKIGGIFLGSRSGIKEAQHWKDMFFNLDQEVVQWHELKGLEKLEKRFPKRQRSLNKSED